MYYRTHGQPLGDTNFTTAVLHIRGSTPTHSSTKVNRTWKQKAACHHLPTTSVVSLLLLLLVQDFRAAFAVVDEITVSLGRGDQAK